MPVAIAPVDRQVRSTAEAFLSECVEQGNVLFIDRAFSFKMLVVLSNFQHAFRRHIAATQHVF